MKKELSEKELNLKRLLHKDLGWLWAIRPKWHTKEVNAWVEFADNSIFNCQRERNFEVWVKLSRPGVGEEVKRINFDSPDQKVIAKAIVDSVMFYHEDIDFVVIVDKIKPNFSNVIILRPPRGMDFFYFFREMAEGRVKVG